MRPWDIFRQGAGCLALFVTFCVGTFFGYSIYWFDDKSLSYIDRETAIQYAIDYERDLCTREDHPHPVDCKAGPIRIDGETKSGWMITVWSADGRRSDTMLVDRRGKTEAEDPRDADGPHWRAPDKPPMPVKAAPGKPTIAG